MAFIQTKLTKSFNQSRGIFDKYIYKPGNGDSIATILGSGYFDDSRYLDDPNWLESIIEISADDGYAIARIVTGGLTVLYDSTGGGSVNVEWGAITGDVNSQADLAEVAKTNDYDDLNNKPIVTIQEQLIYVAKAGNNSNSGLNINQPKLTIIAAINAAILLTPAVENQITIEVIDTGTYLESYDLPEFVHINAQNAANNGRITVSDNTIIRFRRLQNSTVSESVVRKLIGSGFSKITTELMIVEGAMQEGLICNAGLAHIDVGVIAVDAGVGIKAKNGARVSFVMADLQLSNGALGLGTRVAGGGPNFTSGSIAYAIDTDNTCTLVESQVSGDVINIQSGSLITNTLYDMGAGTTLNLFANEVGGSTIADPTATVNTTVSSTGNSVAAIINTMQTRAAFGNTVTDTGIIQIALTGTGDSLLPPPLTPQPTTGGSYNGYERVTGLIEIAASGELSVSNDSFIIGTNGGGDYRTPHAWVDMSSDTTATTVGFVFGIVKASDGLVHYSQRVTGSRMSAQDDRTNTSGGGFVTSLETGDTLSMWVAADKTATITIYDMNIGLEMSIAESLK